MRGKYECSPIWFWSATVVNLSGWFLISLTVCTHSSLTQEPYLPKTADHTIHARSSYFIPYVFFRGSKPVDKLPLRLAPSLHIAKYDSARTKMECLPVAWNTTRPSSQWCGSHRPNFCADTTNTIHNYLRSGIAMSWDRIAHAPRQFRIMLFSLRCWCSRGHWDLGRWFAAWSTWWTRPGARFANFWTRSVCRAICWCYRLDIARSLLQIILIL